MATLSRLQVWTLAARPKTLIASLAPALVGAALALSRGQFDPLLFLITLFTGLTIQIGTNLTNDYCDFVKGADTEERKGFLRVTQAGLVSAEAMKRAIFGVFLIATLAGSYLVYQGGLFIGCMLALYLVLSILYTAGPYPLAYLGMGDLMVWLFYGPGAVMITYYLQTHTFAWEPLVVGIAPGSLSACILIINNIRDVDEDRKAGKKTFVVRFGRKAGKIKFALCLLGAFAPLPFFYDTHPFTLLTLLILLPALPLARAVLQNEDPYALNPLFEKAGKVIALFTFLFFVGWML